MSATYQTEFNSVYEQTNSLLCNATCRQKSLVINQYEQQAIYVPCSKSKHAFLRYWRGLLRNLIVTNLQYTSLILSLRASITIFSWTTTKFLYNNVDYNSEIEITKKDAFARSTNVAHRLEWPVRTPLYYSMLLFDLKNVTVCVGGRGSRGGWL